MRWSGAVAGVTSLMLLAGCGSTSHATSPAGAAPRLFTGHLESLHPGSVTAADLGVADQAFGLRLMHDVCATGPDTNTVLSPASAAQALGMLETGAVGTTRAALSTLLHEPAYGPAVIAAESERTAKLRDVGGLATSNRLFTQAGLTPQQTTLDDLRSAYDTRVQTLDFAGNAKGSTDTINKLVSGDTHGLIPTLFDRPLDSSTLAVLTDAIYLKAQWVTPFQAPVPASFTTAPGKRITVPTLQSEEVSPSTSAAGWQSVELAYAQAQLTAYALLPPAHAGACVVPSAAALTQLLAPDSRTVASVTMPQFHLSQTNHLLDVLSSEGLQPGGDYAGLSPGAQVSEIVQKVDISVDKNGTTAAAATGIVFASSGGTGVAHVVAFDRPFLFLVTDTATHTPLFLTRVADPLG